MKRGACGCRNHRGRMKNKYPTREKAMEAILKFYIHDGLGHEPYPCPRMDGVWHIRTNRRPL